MYINNDTKLIFENYINYITTQTPVKTSQQKLDDLLASLSDSNANVYTQKFKITTPGVYELLFPFCIENTGCLNFLINKGVTVNIRPHPQIKTLPDSEIPRAYCINGQGVINLYGNTASEVGYGDNSSITVNCHDKSKAYIHNHITVNAYDSSRIVIYEEGNYDGNRTYKVNVLSKSVQVVTLAPHPKGWTGLHETPNHPENVIDNTHFKAQNVQDDDISTIMNF